MFFGLVILTAAILEILLKISRYLSIVLEIVSVIVDKYIVFRYYFKISNLLLFILGGFSVFIKSYSSDFETAF